MELNKQLTFPNMVPLAKQEIKEPTTNEQIVFAGMEPLTKQQIKDLKKNIERILRNYHNSKNRLQSLEVLRQQVIALSGNVDEVDLQIKVTKQSMQRTEIALISCSDLQQMILNERFITAEKIKDYVALMNVNLKLDEMYGSKKRVISSKIYDQEIKAAITNFASAYGILI